jgi:hypothetical protein
MKYLCLLLLYAPLSSFAQHFTPGPSPTEFSGTEEYFRTLWFSSDNNTVFGDANSIIGFDIETGDKTLEVFVEGYSVHPSSQSPDGSYWIQGNSNYNNPSNPQITDMHNNLGCYDLLNNTYKAQKTGDLMLSKVVHSSAANSAYGIARRSGIESVIEFQIDPFASSRTIAEEKDGYYILAVAVDEKNGLLAYSYAGGAKGIKIVDLESGALKKNISLNQEVATLDFGYDDNTLIATAYNNLYKIELGSYGLEQFNLAPNNDGSFALSVSVHPNNRSVAYSSKNGTSLLDTETGAVEKIDAGQSMACRFSNDGRYLAVSVKPFLGKSPCLRLFSDSQFANSALSEEVVPTPPPFSPSPDWHQHRGPAFALDFPTKPTVSTKRSKKGYVTSEYTSIHKNSAYLAVVTEISSKVKASKYQRIAGKIGEKFLKKIGAGKSVRQPYSYGEQTGVGYNFKMGAFDYEYLCICINGYAFQIICLNAEQNTDDLDRFFVSFHPLK